MPEQTVAQLAKMLLNLDAWLDEAIAHANEQGQDPEALVEAALTEGMFPLRRQIESACDAAKFAAARLAGQEAPVKEDGETTLAQLKARIAWTRDYLAGFTTADFEGASDRMLSMPFLPDGMRVNALDYATEFAVPNFYFHVTTAYGILRNNGVLLGKRKFIGGLTLHPAG